MTGRKRISFIIKDTDTHLKIGDTLREIRNFPLRMEELFGKIKLQLLEGNHLYGQIATAGTGLDLLEGGREVIGDSAILLKVEERGGIGKVTLLRIKEDTSYYRRWRELKNNREPIGVINESNDIVYLALWKACFKEGKLESVIIGVETDHFTKDGVADFQKEIKSLARHNKSALFFIFTKNVFGYRLIDNMRIKNLSIKNLDQILFLEEQMYWQGKEWQELWQKEAKELFGKMIKEYFEKFPEGCFGIFDEKEGFLGVMIFTKLSEIKTIPYIHNFKDYFAEKGNIAYIQIFAVKKGEQEFKIAETLYYNAEKVAEKIGCDKIAVVIYSSPIEEKILNKLCYKVEKENLPWEIYPKRFVNCKIYTCEI